MCAEWTPLTNLLCHQGKLNDRTHDLHENVSIKFTSSFQICCPVFASICQDVVVVGKTRPKHPSTTAITLQSDWAVLTVSEMHNTLIKSQDLTSPLLFPSLFFFGFQSLPLCPSFPLCGRPLCWPEWLGKSHDLWFFCRPDCLSPRRWWSRR